MDVSKRSGSHAFNHQLTMNTEQAILGHDDWRFRVGSAARLFLMNLLLMSRLPNLLERRLKARWACMGRVKVHKTTVFMSDHYTCITKVQNFCRNP